MRTVFDSNDTVEEAHKHYFHSSHKETEFQSIEFVGDGEERPSQAVEGKTMHQRVCRDL